MVDSTIGEFRGDADRVYLTGLSYGGFGTWHMAAGHPDRWAAIAPICGAGSTQQAKSIAEARLPVWIFQGGRDPTVKAEYVLQTARGLEAAGHPEVRMTVHEDLSHNVWTRVYEGDDLYNWFLRQRRSA
jgi:predicted peptidase